MVNKCKEIQEKKDLYNHSFALDGKRHELKMKELKFKRESDRMHHENEMSRQRIKSAEIRKAQMRKGAGGYNY